MANSNIGFLSTFDGNIETWSTYVERAELYFRVNGIKTDKKVPAILSLIGADTYGLLKTLSAPQSPADLSFEDITSILADHLDPKPSEIGERFRFQKRTQGEGETISDYVAALRKLTIHCNYGAQLETHLRDQFVFGLRDENTQRKLLKDQDLTFKSAVSTAKANEIAMKDIEELHGKSGTLTDVSVNKFNARNDSKPSYKSSSFNGACIRCQRKGHHPDNCRFRDKTQGSPQEIFKAGWHK
jgi:hypothetical protein